MKVVTQWLVGIALALAALYPSVKADQAAAVLEVKPGDSIQAAVDKASAGDVIRVQQGSYAQVVRITKAVTLVAADPDNLPVLAGTGQDNGIYLIGTTAAPVSGVVVRGFVVTKYRTGIRLENATNNVIENCQLISNGNRPMFSGALDNNMALVNASYNLIRGNYFTDGSHNGVNATAGSNYNTFTNNRSFSDGMVAGNAACAFELVGCNYNRLLANTPISSGQGVVLSGGSTGNVVADNLLLDNQRVGITANAGSNPAKGNVIADNIVLRSGGSGVAPAVDLADGVPGNNTWRDNVFGTKNF